MEFLGIMKLLERKTFPAPVSGRIFKISFLMNYLLTLKCMCNIFEFMNLELVEKYPRNARWPRWWKIEIMKMWCKRFSRIKGTTIKFNKVFQEDWDKHTIFWMQSQSRAEYIGVQVFLRIIGPCRYKHLVPANPFNVVKADQCKLFLIIPANWLAQMAYSFPEKCRPS